MPAFVPSADRPPDELVAEFERWQAETIACVREAEGLPLQRVKVVSPFDARVRYNLFSALSILAPISIGIWGRPNGRSRSLAGCLVSSGYRSKSNCPS